MSAIPEIPEVVGQSVVKNDAFSKVTGRARYTDDLDIPGLAWGMILRSPYAFCDVVSLDVSEALEVEGVLGVLLPEDVPQSAFNCSGNPPSPLLIPDERVLTRHALCVGDRIAAVAGTTLSSCREAIRAIRVEYSVKKQMFSIREALAEGAPALHPEI
jgi:xanthine dehydrogenase molybdenum-binding subunit/putative selenate reductase molybdopterin-binding subunit